MGFLKLFWKIFEAFRDRVQTFTKWAWGKLQNEDAGKLKGINPTNIPKILVTVGIVVFIVLIIIKFSTPDDKITGGLAEFEKEVNPVSSVDNRFDSKSLDSDIDKALSSIQSDSPNPISTSLTDSLSGSSVLSVSDCLEVINKLKTGTKLSDKETGLANQCIAENPMGLTPDDLILAQKLVDPNLTDAERKFLGKALAGELTPDERALALALAGTDAEKAKLAAAAINSGDPAMIAAAAKSVQGKELSDEEKALIAKIKTETGTTVKLNELDGKTATGTSTNIPQALEARSVSISEREKEIAKQERLANMAQTAAGTVANKIQAGDKLTEADSRRLQELTQARNSVEALKKTQAAEKAALAKQMEQIKEALSRTSATVGKISPTGLFIEYEGEDPECKPKARPFVKKKVVVKGPAYVDLDNRPLNPEEVEYIKLIRKKGDKVEAQDTSAGFIGGLGAPITIASNGEGQQTDLNQMIVFKDQGLKDCELTPDMKIPAELDSEILISDKGGSQIVRMKILADVYCPTSTHQLVLPKGSIAIAQSTGFDAETGIMYMNTDKISIGSGKVSPYRLSVGSANGSSGLKGEVRDTTGKYLLGAFIPAFAGAALSYFSQQVTQPYLQSTNAGTAITGAALAGSSEVMNRIAELAASKLLGAAKIFWVPRGVPIVLYPN